MRRLNQALGCGLIVVVFLVAAFSPRFAAASLLPIPPFPYQEQGPFVQVPAVIGGLILAIPGAVVGPVVCFFNGNLSPRPLKQLGECSAIGALISSMAGSAIVGSPFYVVKKILCDFPRQLLGIDSRPPVTEGLQPGVGEKTFEGPQLQEGSPDTAAP